MNPNLIDLTNRITALENMLKGRSTSFDEKIRNIVTYDIDNATVTTHVVTANVSGGGGLTVSVTTPKDPDTYLRIKFRGTTYNIPVYKLS